MDKTWLVLDVNQLAWAAFHTTGGLSYNNTPTGVAFGVFSAIHRLEIDLDCKNFVFCFDCGESKRYNLCPTYKASRKKRRESDEREKAIFIQVIRQIEMLRTTYLKQIGFRNVFSQPGFEADDLIASVCMNLPEGDKAIIVSSDKDMYQLLSKRVSIYTRTNILTRKLFREQYGITPKQWIDVKCLVGCATDCIPGIKGVGEKSAIKYLLGELDKKSTYHKKIRKGIKQGIMEVNTPLVKLPFEGTPQLILKRDKELKWSPVLKELNIKSLSFEQVPAYME